MVLIRIFLMLCYGKKLSPYFLENHYGLETTGEVSFTIKYTFFEFLDFLLRLKRNHYLLNI